ncbi:hypothetical protein [Gracilimonas sp.]|uniref:hypothetical protein n=1 Tax=Gracilimonas sp. TaxID=1974203 RepID=UPI0032ECB36D
MLQFIKKLFNGDQVPPELPPEPDFASIIKQIKKQEDTEELQPGKKIHEFEYHLFSIRLDRDITKNYRITVFQGNERIYSFTVFVEKKELEKLDKAYQHVISFLMGDQSISSLPDNDLIKGFYFGNR